QAGAFPVGARQAVVDVDAFGLDTEAEQGIALRGEVLLIGGASGVPDKQCAHGAPPGSWARPCHRMWSARAPGQPGSTSNCLSLSARKSSLRDRRAPRSSSTLWNHRSMGSLGIDALVVDVLGTLVDEPAGISQGIRELAPTLDEAGV